MQVSSVVLEKRDRYIGLLKGVLGDPEMFDLTTCFTCGLCASGCPLTGVDGMDPRKLIRMCATGMLKEAIYSKFPWICTCCGRCAYYCPMEVNIPLLITTLKGLRPRHKLPGNLQKTVETTLKSGNIMGISKEDYLFLLHDVAEELADSDCPGFEIPIDQVGAEYLFFPNGKEVFGDPEDMKWMWKVFYAAEVSWTVPSENWESEDYGIFTGDEEASKEFARRKVELAKKLKVKYLIMPDCGGSSFGARLMFEKYFKEELRKHGIELVYIYDVLIRFLKEGRIKVDKKRHPLPVTYHDSCKHGRELERLFGKGYYEEPRWIIRQCCERFVEMYPNRQNSFCCGAGGGVYGGPYEKERLWHGRMKAESIKRSGAKVVVVSCSNCRDQIMRWLKKKYDLDVEVKYLWQIVAEAIIL